MSDATHIFRYLSFLEESYSSILQNGQMTDEAVKMADRKLSFIRQIQSNVHWQLLPKEEKQAHRISWLASLEKRGSANYKKKKDTVELYATIQSALPHIIVLDQNGRLSKIREICTAICELIDFKGWAIGQVDERDFPLLSEAINEINDSENNQVPGKSSDILFDLKNILIKYFDLN